MLKYGDTGTALVTQQKKLEVAKSASAIGLLCERELRSSVEQWQTALVANGHDWQTIADLIGKQYLGKTTLICEPTMRNNDHQLLFAVANNKLWRVSEDIVKTVAPTVERARHNHHGKDHGNGKRKKVTHPDTVAYDDLCYEAMVKENIQLNHY